jgi:hypothetical protein
MKQNETKRLIIAIDTENETRQETIYNTTTGLSTFVYIVQTLSEE